MYDRTLTECFIEVDMTKLIDGPIDYLCEGLKEYSSSQLNQIENYAKSNIRMQSSGADTGNFRLDCKEHQYLMKLGAHNYIPSTVIDAIAKEKERRRG